MEGSVFFCPGIFFYPGNFHFARSFFFTGPSRVNLPIRGRQIYPPGGIFYPGKKIMLLVSVQSVLNSKKKERWLVKFARLVKIYPGKSGLNTRGNRVKIYPVNRVNFYPVTPIYPHIIFLTGSKIRARWVITRLTRVKRKHCLRTLAPTQVISVIRTDRSP